MLKATSQNQNEQSCVEGGINIKYVIETNILSKEIFLTVLLILLSISKVL